MASRDEGRRLSNRPSQADKGGGKFQVPPDVEVVISDIAWDVWGSAGEGALKGGKRKANDPALRVTVDSDDFPDGSMTEFLGCGKGAAREPSEDGEFLLAAEGSSATATAEGSNAHVFIDSACDKKVHKKNAVNEDILDDGISQLLGLRFITGRKIVEGRSIQEEGTDKTQANRPTLYVKQIVEGPTGKAPKGKSSASKRDRDKDEDDRPARSSSRDRDRDEDDDRKKDRDRDDDRPARRSSSKDDDEPDVVKIAEDALIDALDTPKYRKGIPIDKAFSVGFNMIREKDLAKKVIEAVGELHEDEKWVGSTKRPWKIDDGMIVTN